MEDYIAHFGIKGQRWGVRRYQNPDGSLTEAGKDRYSRGNTAGINVISYQRYKARDIRDNPNKYHRLSDKQKEKHDFKSRIDLEDRLERLYDDLENNEKTWNKWATKYLESQYEMDHYYDDRDPYDRNERKKYVNSLINETRNNDRAEVWRFYVKNDPEAKRLNKKAEEWLKEVLDSEEETGVRSSEINDQIFEEFSERYKK